MDDDRADGALISGVVAETTGLLAVSTARASIIVEGAPVFLFVLDRSRLSCWRKPVSKPLQMSALILVAPDLAWALSDHCPLTRLECLSGDPIVPPQENFLDFEPARPPSSSSSRSPLRSVMMMLIMLRTMISLLPQTQKLQCCCLATNCCCPSSLFRHLSTTAAGQLPAILRNQRLSSSLTLAFVLKTTPWMALSWDLPGSRR